ncbi:MAG: hypothetical protein K0Q68_2407 [Moraxellaceae bacterium]|jgi:hypothetical protein|nr:hypothetical protein [Moraxellaceae bacterium]
MKVLQHAAFAAKTGVPATLCLALAACSAMSVSTPAFVQDALPAAVKAPAGHAVALESVGVGEITYECRARADNTTVQEWVFVGPRAELRDRAGKAIGSYFGPPATWVSQDGSAITGAQLAIAPSAPGNIPLQLVKANASAKPGVLAGVAYIQRVATRGGVAPASECSAATLGKREIVKYQADYIFWKPA